MSYFKTQAAALAYLDMTAEADQKGMSAEGGTGERLSWWGRNGCLMW